ncbi:hypothetical protein GCM10012287_45630 [Streptomyces daqingensis]|uniref:Secreted protein n=1 Tax=Streptomyces daqingensis TaxID=1472640 RepID=A0ABQ2MRW2_9ACTN|nr:hypothetical protein GCM10012287_45630 [Streptomyces daqingensis]
MCIVLLSIVVETLSSESVATAPHTMKASVSRAVTPNTTLSVWGTDGTFRRTGGPVGGSSVAFRSTRLSGTLWTFQFSDFARIWSSYPTI